MKPLCEVLDKKNYKRIVSEFGGRRIWIPKDGNNGFRNKEYFLVRNKTVISLRKQGMGIKDLSKKFKLSAKSIYNITNPNRLQKNNAKLNHEIERAVHYNTVP